MHFADQPQIAELVERVEDLGFIVFHHGRAVAFLVAARREGFGRERILVGRGEGFFQEHAQHAALLPAEFGNRRGIFGRGIGQHRRTFFIEKSRGLIERFAPSRSAFSLKHARFGRQAWPAICRRCVGIRRGKGHRGAKENQWSAFRLKNGMLTADC